MHIEPDAMQRKIIRLQIACGQAVRSFVCIYLFILHCASSHHLNLVPQAQMCYFLFFIFPLNLAVSFTQAISQISTSFLFKGTRCRRSRGNVCSETGWGRRLCTTRCWLCGCSTACPNNSAHDGFLQPVQWDWGALGVPCFCWWEAVGFQGGLGGEGRNKMGVVRSWVLWQQGQRGRGPSGPSRWLLSSRVLISTPSMLPLARECRVGITEQPFLQCAQHRGYWGRDTNTGNLFR